MLSGGKLSSPRRHSDGAIVDGHGRARGCRDHGELLHALFRETLLVSRDRAVDFLRIRRVRGAAEVVAKPAQRPRVVSELFVRSCDVERERSARGEAVGLEEEVHGVLEAPG
jgi:hypothetical protein